MQKVFFYKKKSTNQDINRKRLFDGQHTSKKQVVDINKLLNRVKLNKIDEKKKNVTYIVYTLLGLCFSAYIIFK